jgi:hypothetical protein
MTSNLRTCMSDLVLGGLEMRGGAVSAASFYVPEPYRFYTFSHVRIPRRFMRR